MSLNTYAEHFKLPLAEHARSRRQILVVTRLNLGVPRLVLFTSDPRPDRRFDAVRALDFRELVDELRPALVEREQRGGIPGASADLVAWSTYEAPAAFVARQGLAAAAGVHEACITPSSYLWSRASSGTEQEEYLAAQRADELLLGGEGAPEQLIERRGRQTLGWFRRALRDWTGFQSRVVLVVDSLLLTLEACAGLPLPAFHPGDPLPGGLVEEALHLAFDERSDAALRLDAIDFDLPRSPWRALVDDASLRENLKIVIHTWRDVLRGRAAQHDDRTVHLRPIGDVIGELLQTHERLGPAVVGEFRTAQSRWAELCDFSRNKLMLGYLLQYVLAAFKDLRSTRSLRRAVNSSTLYAAIEKEIRTGSAEVAPPVRRPSREERRSFEADLVRSLSQVIDASVAAPERAAEITSALSPSLVGLVERLRGDRGRLTALETLAGLDPSDPRRGRLLRLLHVFVADVLAPALYRKPELTYTELSNFVSAELANLFLAAVALTPGNIASVRRLGESYAKRLEECVVGEGRLGGQRDVVSARLVEELLGFTLSDGVVRVVEQANAMLADAALVASLDAMSVGERPALPCPLLPNPTDEVREMLVATGERSPPQRERVERHAHALAGPLLARHEAGARDAVPAVVRRVLVQMDGAEVLDGSDEGDAPPPPAFGPIDEEGPNLALALRAARFDPADGPPAVARALADDPAFAAASHRATTALSQIRSAIYEAYASPHANELTTFRRDVERFALAELLLGTREQLGLGGKGSYLYRLLLDLVACTDPDAPDLATFLRTHSLTEYIDIEGFDGQFFSILEQVVAQGDDVLAAVAGFVSELRGLEHLFRHAPRDAEIILFNGTAEEFSTWVERDNFEPGGRRRMLVGERDRVRPSLLVLGDAAFPTPASRRDWMTKNLGEGAFRTRFVRDGAAVLLPPMCLSVAGDNWEAEGKALAALAQELVLPVHVAGPSPELNRRGDPVRTYLPAGFLVGAHALGGVGQLLSNQGLRKPSRGRLQVVGSGSAPFDESLRRVFWGAGEAGVAMAMPLVADQYLFLILSLIADAKDRGDSPGDDRQAAHLYRYLVRTDNGFNDLNYRESERLDGALPGGLPGMPGGARCLALDADPTTGSLSHVLVALTAAGVAGGPCLRATDIAWFTRIRSILGLP